MKERDDQDCFRYVGEVALNESATEGGRVEDEEEKKESERGGRVVMASGL